MANGGPVDLFMDGKHLYFLQLIGNHKTEPEVKVNHNTYLLRILYGKPTGITYAFVGHQEIHKPYWKLCGPNGLAGLVNSGISQGKRYMSNVKGTTTL